MEKRKFDLFVHGNIISKSYLASGELPDANIFGRVPYESVDLMHGIIVEGKVFEAVTTESHTCMCCDLIDDMGECVCRDFCFELGRNNIFRYSQSLTDKINEK